MQTKLAPRPPPTPSPPTAPYPFQSLESANAVLLPCPDSAAFRRDGDGFATPQRVAKYQQPALLAPRKGEESFLSPEAHQRCITPRGLNFTPPSANMIAANLFQRGTCFFFVCNKKLCSFFNATFLFFRLAKDATKSV